MHNRRGKLHIPYLALFSGILIVVVIANLILFPEWRESPATMIALLVAAIVGVVGLAANFRQAFIRDDGNSSPGKLDYDSPQHCDNHENVCNIVRSDYIDSRLRESLPEQVRLALTLDSLPGLVQRQMVCVMGRAPRREPVSEVQLADVFRRSGRALLILGAPGSGKTVTLLELCQPLLEEAEADSRRPVPVVLNLSTWAQKQGPLEVWIADEMLRQYGLSRRVTPIWLAADHLILLLDGLDEVAGDARDACVRAINAFREHYSAGMVVCSRSSDYKLLSKRLALSRAVEIRPLTPEQVDAYLGDERLGLTAVRQAIAHDDALRELSATPLMLNVMAVAYRGLSFDRLLPLLDTQTERRAHLYDRYIECVFDNRPLPAEGYHASQALCWLRFLAQRLMERSETQFFIEDMQPDWLPSRRGRWVGVLFGVLVGTLFGLIVGVLFGKLVGLLGGLLVGLQVGSSAVVGNIRPVDELAWNLSRQAIGQAVLAGVLGGLLFGVLFDDLFGVLGGVLFGVWVGMLRPLESKHRYRPNQGIHRSARNALRAGVPAGVLGGVPLGVLYDMPNGVLGGVISGMTVSVLYYGGKAVIRHYILRALLSLHRLLPLRLVPFLETMRARILLQRAGGHYRFIHRTFQEHIAALTDEQIEALLR